MSGFRIRDGGGAFVVAFGGGTGLSTMLRGLKKRTGNITAIVTVADDGGGSGRLRNELGMLPPGDIRMCLEALANTEPMMEKILAYRFESGSLKGQSFGNLFIAALNGVTGSFEEAVARMSEVVAITGKVLPATTSNVNLIAEFEDGTKVFGETRIAQYKRECGTRIKRIEMTPPDSAALPESIEAIKAADMIVFGPGSLYTSIIPNILTGGVVDAIIGSEALKVYISNIMTQYGETDGYTVGDHIKAIFDHAGGNRLFDFCLANSAGISEEVLERYREERSEPIIIDDDEIKKLGVELIRMPAALAVSRLVRHDEAALAESLMNLFYEKKGNLIL